MFQPSSKNVPRLRHDHARDQPLTMPLDSPFSIVDFRANARYATARRPSLFIKSTDHSAFPLPSPPQSDFESFAARNVLSMHLRGRAAVRDA